MMNVLCCYIDYCCLLTVWFSLFMEPEHKVYYLHVMLELLEEITNIGDCMSSNSAINDKSILIELKNLIRSFYWTSAAFA